jgi:hypothetical protein
MQLNNKVQDAMQERWITQIRNGIVTLVQRIAADAFVVRAQDLPTICANQELVTDEQAMSVAEAILSRLE